MKLPRLTGICVCDVEMYTPQRCDPSPSPMLNSCHHHHHLPCSAHPDSIHCHGDAVSDCRRGRSVVMGRVRGEGTPGSLLGFHTTANIHLALENCIDCQR